MDNRRALVKATLYAMISDILSWLQTDGRHVVQTRREFERKDMNHFFIVIGELDELREVGNNLHTFQIAAIGNPDRYPIDIMEIVYRNKDEFRRGGVFIKFRGGEIPLVLNPDVAVLDTFAINALIDVVVDSNTDLVNLIEKSGGKYVIKRSRK